MRRVKFRRRRRQYDSDSDEEETKEPQLSFTGLDIQPIQSKSTDIYITENMRNKIIPRHPFSLNSVGKSGSGKTNTMVFCLLNEGIYKGYFQEIYVFGATVASDGMYKHLRIPKKRTYTKDLVSNLDTLIERLEEESEKKGPARMKRRLIIFEDVSSEGKLMRSKSFLKCYVQNRHLNLSVWANSHKYKLLPRTCRLNCSGIFLFRTTEDEIAQIAEDWQPANMLKNEFIDLIHFAHKPTEDMRRPFLFINAQADEKNRYRKSLSIMLELEPRSPGAKDRL